MHHPNDSIEDVFPARTFNPDTLIDLETLNEDWEQYRVLAWDLVISSWSTKYRHVQRIIPIAPLIMVFALLMLLIQLVFDLNASGTLNLNFSFIALTTILLVACIWVRDLTQIGVRMQNRGDLSLYLNISEWVRNRYHTDYDITDDLTGILSGEPPQYRKGPRLTVVTINGEEYLMLKNGAQEASRK